MPDQILIGVLILLTLTAAGTLAMWMSWNRLKRLYESHSKQVPINIRHAQLAMTGCVIAPPLILVFALIFLI